MIKWVVLVVGSSSIKTDFSCIKNQVNLEYAGFIAELSFKPTSLNFNSYL